jgi:pimeloyl-ACP methyl ester carboxylesterase
METLTLGDGRVLAYEVWGEPDGVPVMFQHGTGDSRLARHPDPTVTSALGVRLVTVDRPGVGGSTPRPDRTLLDWACDAEALADALHLERFAVAGWSGGAPHALAMAYRLGDRVSTVALASALAPFDEPGARDLVLNRDLRMIWKLSHVKLLARLIGRHEAGTARNDLDRFVDQIAKDAPADAAVLTDPELHPMFEEEMGAALAQGGAGVLDDMWAFLDWGFRPEDVTQHVEVFHGRDDEILGHAMGRKLAGRLPDSAFPTLDGGHYTVFAHWPEFLAPTGLTVR